MPGPGIILGAEFLAATGGDMTVFGTADRLAAASVASPRCPVTPASRQWGAALVLAVPAETGDSGGDFIPCRPGLDLVTSVAAIGLLLNLVSASRRRRR